MPAHGRNHSSQVLSINNHNILIDCGEGTQHQINKYNVKPSKIEAIFISHLHGDHYLGLMGLISSMHIQGRTKPLKVFAPNGLKEILMVQLKYSNTSLNFKLELKELDIRGIVLIYQSKSYTVEAFPLNHRIPCFGFLIREKKKPIRINKERLPDNISIQDIASLKKGQDILDKSGNVVYRNEYLTLPPRKSRSFAYCSDTIYDENLLQYIQGVDLLYHESTFLEERVQSAKDT
jgi:ribonuclease Z